MMHKQAVSLDDEVAVTLKMESYLSLHTQPINGTLPAPEEPVVVGVDAIDKVAQLTCFVEELGEHVETVQQRTEWEHQHR